MSLFGTVKSKCQIMLATQAPAPEEQAAAGQRAMQALLGCLGAAQPPPPPLPPQPVAGSSVGAAAAAAQPGPLLEDLPVSGRAGGPAAPLHAAAAHPAPPAPPRAMGPGQGAGATCSAGPEPGAPEALRALVGALRNMGHLCAVAAAAAGALSASGALDSAPSRLAADPALAPRLQPGLAAVQACALELGCACYVLHATDASLGTSLLAASKESQWCLEKNRTPCADAGVISTHWLPACNVAAGAPLV